MRSMPLNISQVTMPVVLGLVVSWIAIVAVTFLATREIDASGMERDVRLANSTTRLIGGDVSALAKDYALWNEAIRNLVVDLDPVWAHDTIGTYLHDAFGITGAFVVQPDGRTRIAFENGEPSTAQAVDRFSAGLAGLIAESEGASDTESVPVYGLFPSQGQLHVVAASVFMQEKPGDGLDLPRPRPALVLSRVLDEALMSEYAEILQLPELRLEAEVRSAPATPVKGRDGVTLGYLTWDSRPAGNLLLRSVALPIAVAILFTALLATLFWRRAYEIFRTQDELRAANLAKDKFLSSMSHELRTPLNAILGFGQLLESADDPSPAEQRRAARYIVEAGNHLLHLVNQILDLAQIDSGNLDIPVEPSACAEIVEPCLSMARSMSRKFDVAVAEARMAGALPHVLVNPTRGKQILLNLLSNAVKYNRPGGSVRLDVRETAHGTVRFAVTDTGPGIPADKIAMLFTPFNRLESGHGAVEGTGVGLAITKELVQLMGGDIGVESSVGKGSTFWFELPVAPRPFAREAAPAATAETPPASPAGPRSILYIEDHPANAELMQRIFADGPKFSFRTVETAEEGLKLVKEAKPDLILMDINLPGMSGIDACRILKANTATADIPVIAVTAGVLEHNAGSAEELGFADFIAKPFRVADVRSRVERLLEG